MRHYRVYYFDGSGRIVDARNLQAEDESQALALFARIEHNDVVELWERARLVSRREDGSGVKAVNQPSRPERTEG